VNGSGRGHAQGQGGETATEVQEVVQEVVVIEEVTIQTTNLTAPPAATTHKPAVTASAPAPAAAAWGSKVSLAQKLKIAEEQSKLPPPPVEQPVAPAAEV
jgi:hypothetical protein